MNQQGRPRLLADDEKRRLVCAMISVGAGIEAAARHAGCSTWTIRREAQRDEAFGRQLQQAETTAELTPLRMVRRAAETHWRAAAWLLERMCPERFARRAADSVAPDEVKSLLDKAASILVDECYDQSQQQRVVGRLQQLQQDHFGARRAQQQGPPQPKSDIDRMLDGMLDRVRLEVLSEEFCLPKGNIARINGPTQSGDMTRKLKASKE
ncbi:MAG: hypothetical protein KDA44_16260 [Planctomycetales bacterium]|nr:hypothetical protein [Planctomycetales bacterium]